MCSCRLCHTTQRGRYGWAGADDERVYPDTAGTDKEANGVVPVCGDGHADLQLVPHASLPGR